MTLTKKQKALEERNNKIYEKLVPVQGKAETLQGEMLRAINRLIYRFHNDGDYWFDGPGIDSVGSVESFLMHCARCKYVDIAEELLASQFAKEKKYEKQIYAILEKILDHIESCNGEYAPNQYDMYDFPSKYKRAYYEDEDEWSLGSVFKTRDSVSR